MRPIAILMLPTRPKHGGTNNTSPTDPTALGMRREAVQAVAATTWQQARSPCRQPLLGLLLCRWSGLSSLKPSEVLPAGGTRNP